MRWFARFGTVGSGVRDGVAYFTEARPYRGWLWAASFVIPAIIFALVDGQFRAEPVYQPPEIVYVQPWTTDRSVAEIRAQQARDLPAERARKDAEAKARADRQAQFQRIEAEMKKIGM